MIIPFYPNPFGVDMQPTRRILSHLFSAALLVFGLPRAGFAQTPAAAPDSASSASQSPTLEEVLVVGKGSTRESQTLTREQLSQAAPGSNPLEVLGTLPGVSFNSSDPLALDPYSANIYMRGFTEDQLGFTLDGVPLGAQGYGSSGQGYGNIGGININSAIISDNIDRVNVSQGAGPVDVASASNLGGVIQFFSLDPTEKADATISQAFGSFHTFRTFARVDSGTLNDSGTRFFVSYGRTDEDKWKGAGSMFQQQVNAKIVQPLEGHGTLSAFFDWDDEAEATYSDLSKNILNTLGPDVDYYYPNYAAAYHAAQGIYPPGYNKLVDPLDASYYDGPSKAINYLGYVKLDLDVSEAAQWKSTAYIHHKDFAGYYTSPYYPSPDGAPLSEEEFASYSLRRGVTSDVVYKLEQHTLNAGVWYEHLHAYVPENLYSEPVLGEGSPLNPLGDLPAAYATPWAYTYSDNTKQAHLQDTYQVTPNLRLNAGFRSLFFTGTSGIVQNEAAYSGYTSLPSGSLSANNAFLPQISGNWEFTPGQETFFNASKNMRVFSQSGLQEGSPWGVAQQGLFSQLQNTLKPEQDFVYEAGYRYTSRSVVGLLTLYHVDFSNRLQAIAVGPLADIQATIANVGDVRMNGLDANLIVRPIDSISISNSISLNSAKYQSDLTSGGETYALKDKQEVNYPELMYKARLSYTYGNMSAHIDGQYMGRRYISYNNDNYAPGYWVSNAGISERMNFDGSVKTLTLGLNVYNLFNATYISITGETGNPLSGDYQTFQIGAPRMIYGSLSAAF
jgi:iron complex outermembrane receptor protein